MKKSDSKNNNEENCIKIFQNFCKMRIAKWFCKISKKWDFFNPHDKIGYNYEIKRKLHKFFSKFSQNRDCIVILKFFTKSHKMEK